MICTVDDFKLQYPDVDKTDEEIQRAVDFASTFIEKIISETFESPLPFSHPLNLACRKIAYYELFPEKKERLGIVEERLEGYSYTKANVPSIYGDPEIDKILALYMKGVRIGAG